MFLGYNFRIMLKWLTVLGSSFLVLAVVLVAGYDKAHDTEEKGYDIKCTPSSEPSATTGSIVCTAEHSQKAKSGQRDSLWWHIFIAWPEGITTLAIIATGFVIAWQAVATQQAANAGKTAAESAKDSAIAARKSAEAVFAAERPWLVESIGQLGNSKYIWIVSMRNTGNTPAEISDGYSSRDFMYPDFNLPAAPARHSFPLQRTLIVKEDSFEVYKIDTEPIHENALDRLNRDGESFFIFGDVRYWDTFTAEKDRVKPHVSEWCYIYNTFTREFTRAPCTYHGHS